MIYMVFWVDFFDERDAYENHIILIKKSNQETRFDNPEIDRLGKHIPINQTINQIGKQSRLNLK